MKDERFINPYNFVPLVGKCERKSASQGPLTGKITCILKTLTPLFIPDAQQKSEFFHYGADKTPVIPGSELRGTIRSVFEAAFNGCLSQVNTEYFHRRSKDIKYPGIIRKTKNGWELQKCRKEKNSSKWTSQEGKCLFYKPNFKTSNLYFTDQNKDGQENWKKAFVHRGEYGPKGVSKLLFCPEGESISIKSSEIERLEQILLLYENNNKNSNRHSGYQEYMKLFKKIKNQQLPLNKDLILPVYYYEHNGTVGYLAPAAISQEVFMKTLQTLLDKQGGYNPCECSVEMCPVCNLFGFVSKTDARASRVRFGDAVSISEISNARDIIRLPALGEPKPGAVEFYTEASANIREKYWTYDYYKIGKKRIALKPNELKIRGRKFYWHHKVANHLLKPVDPDEKVPKMECNIQPLEGGSEFVFTVYFEQLTKEELKQICWTLDFGNSTAHAHKIGRAKPLGFGSVQIRIDEIMARTIDKKSGQWKFGKYDISYPNIDEMNKKAEALLHIMQYPSDFQEQIQYPKVYSEKQGVNATASHKWFAKNMEKNYFNQVLPTIEEEFEPKQAEK
ncbi:TIGR03986 family CRISPR-associated RAMP protein [Metasolibacillus meyeri]|uniref:TIGR03986 family type III CRISPR-associated RAMP protein n=1 Tax=Metasolibacillus meyeri TaxID=1071052 RepID=UPI000D2F7006|nr:TIGR03986 family CRISPR-associated RAMP protein [Metasolibacillus meyeri]